MPAVAVSVLSLALALVFAWAALAKVVRFPDWASALVAYRLPDPLRAVAAVAVPAAEVAVVALVVAGATRAGAALTVALIAAFSFALVRARADTDDDRLPCGCFGKAKARDYRLMLIRNALLGGLAAALLLSGRDVGFLEGISAPRGGELLPALLGLAGVLLGGWLIYESAASFKGRRPQ